MRPLARRLLFFLTVRRSSNQSIFEIITAGAFKLDGLRVEVLQGVLYHRDHSMATTTHSYPHTVYKFNLIELLCLYSSIKLHVSGQYGTQDSHFFLHSLPTECLKVSWSKPSSALNLIELHVLSTVSFLTNLVQTVRWGWPYQGMTITRPWLTFSADYEAVFRGAVWPAPQHGWPWAEWR